MDIETRTLELPACRLTISAPGRDPLTIEFPHGGKLEVAPDVRSLGTGSFENPDMVPVLEKLLSNLNLPVKLINRGGNSYEVFAHSAQVPQVQVVLAGLGQLVAMSHQAKVVSGA